MNEIKLTPTIMVVIPFLTSSHANGVVKQIAHVLLFFMKIRNDMNAQYYSQIHLKVHLIEFVITIFITTFSVEISFRYKVNNE